MIELRTAGISLADKNGNFFGGPITVGKAIELFINLHNTAVKLSDLSEHVLGRATGVVFGAAVSINVDGASGMIGVLVGVNGDWFVTVGQRAFERGHGEIVIIITAAVVIRVDQVA